VLDRRAGASSNPWREKYADGHHEPRDLPLDVPPWPRPPIWPDGSRPISPRSRLATNSSRPRGRGPSGQLHDLASASSSISSSTTFPTPWRAAIASAVALGVWMVNVHASGGPAMLKAAAPGRVRLPAGRAPLGHRRHRPDQPLRSRCSNHVWNDPQPAAAGGASRPARTQAAGLDGVVASPQEIGLIRRACGSAFLIVTRASDRPTPS